MPLHDIDWILSGLSNTPFDAKTKLALQQASYIVRQLNQSLGGNATAEHGYDVLNVNYLKQLLDNGVIDSPKP